MGNAISAATFSMLARNDGIGEFDQTECQLGVAHRLALALDLGLGDGEARTVVNQLRRDRKHLSGRHEGAQLRLLHGGEERHAGELVHRDQEPAGGLRHRLDQEHAGHQRMTREMALEDRGRRRNGRLGANRLVVKLEFDNPVDEEEVLEAHAISITRARRPLRRSARRSARRGSSARNTARSSPCRR